MTTVGTVLYVTFGMETEPAYIDGEPLPVNATRYLTWQCPLDACAHVQRMNSNRLNEDLECCKCGLRMTPALGLHDEVVAGYRGAMHPAFVVTPDGGLMNPGENVGGTNPWWATRTWKYTISTVGHRPSRFQLLYDEEVEGESITPDPTTFDQSELLESLWTKDDAGQEQDWEDIEEAREQRKESATYQIEGYRLEHEHSASSRIWMRPERRREEPDEG